MILNFTEITTGLYKFISNCKPLLKKIKNLIQSWIKYGTIDEDDPHTDVTKKTIRAINDDDELWDIFSSYFSFFNFKLVEQALDIVNYEVGKDRMEIYKQEFNCYLKRRVTQCPSGIGMKGEDHVTLLVELDNAFADCRIEHLLLLGDDICNIMNFKADKLQIEGISKGCICVAFHLHKSEILQGSFLLCQQIELLQKLRYMSAKILKVKCNGVCYLINGETRGMQYLRKGMAHCMQLLADSITQYTEPSPLISKTTCKFIIAIYVCCYFATVIMCSYSVIMASNLVQCKLMNE